MPNTSTLHKYPVTRKIFVTRVSMFDLDLYRGVFISVYTNTGLHESPYHNISLHGFNSPHLFVSSQERIGAYL